MDKQSDFLRDELQAVDDGGSSFLEKVRTLKQNESLGVRGGVAT